MHRWSVSRLALVLGLCLATPASAQMTYGGYDLGPDYGAMYEEELRKFNQFGSELAAYERQVTEQAMADPLCQRLYQGHQQQGGQMPYPNFAFLCWATRHFTPDGIAYFQQTEQENWKKEYLAAIDLRKMEAIRGEAQNDWSAGFETNKLEFGAALVGKTNYLDPYSGATVELPNFTQPNEPYWDAATQAYYVMDPAGAVMKWHDNAWQTIERQQRTGQ
jgi:hypothetical protein